MRLLVPAFLLLLCAPVASEDRPEDGFYLRARDAGTRSAMSQDGERLFLGDRAPLRVSGRSFVSQDNGNSRFSLTVEIPYDEAVGTDTYVLVVAGTGYRQSGCGSSGKETSSLHFHVSGDEAAKAVGSYVGTPVLCRSHPGHRLRVTLAPKKDTLGPGEEVTETLRIVNVGTSAVVFLKGGRNRAARDNQYVFSAYLGGKQVEDVGTTHHFGGLSARVVLKPGEAFEDTISLSKWFLFKQAGAYQIHGSYYLEFLDSLSDSFRPIWEDYVAADCAVCIKAA